MRGVLLLFDLYECLKKSGYYYHPEQRTAEQFQAEFLVMKTDDVADALPVISNFPDWQQTEERPWFNMRLSQSDYNTGKLGSFPTQVITAADVIENPGTLALLLGEIGTGDYFSGRQGYYDGVFVFDERRNHVRLEVINRRGNHEYGMSQEEALADGRWRAKQLAEVTQSGKQTFNHVTYLPYLDHISPAVNIIFDHDAIYVDGTAVFGIGSISYHQIRADELRARMDTVDSRIKPRIQIVIGVHDLNAQKTNTGHYPVFNVLLRH